MAVGKRPTEKQWKVLSAIPGEGSLSLAEIATLTGEDRRSQRACLKNMERSDIVELVDGRWRLTDIGVFYTLRATKFRQKEMLLRMHCALRTG